MISGKYIAHTVQAGVQDTPGIYVGGSAKGGLRRSDPGPMFGANGSARRHFFGQRGHRHRLTVRRLGHVRSLATLAFLKRKHFVNGDSQ